MGFRMRPDGKPLLMTAEEANERGVPMECDYCHVPMLFEEYSEHACDGLRGLNPLQEKLKTAKWRRPGGDITGVMTARGNIRKANALDRFIAWLRG